MKTYIMPVSWTMATTMTIKANSKNEAIEIAYNAPLPEEGEYVNDSFEVIEEVIETYYLQDKNGITIVKGMMVKVPDPDETDTHHHSFEGMVKGCRKGNVIVVDNDFGGFEIEPDRLEVIERQ